jgi:hypothetical protein
MMMEVVCTSETSVYFHETTRRHIPESCHLSTDTSPFPSRRVSDVFPSTHTHADYSKTCHGGNTIQSFCTAEDKWVTWCTSLDVTGLNTPTLSPYARSVTFTDESRSFAYSCCVGAGQQTTCSTVTRDAQPRVITSHCTGFEAYKPAVDNANAKLELNKNTHLVRGLN